MDNATLLYKTIQKDSESILKFRDLKLPSEQPRGGGGWGGFRVPQGTNEDVTKGEPSNTPPFAALITAQQRHPASECSFKIALKRKL